MSELDRLHDAVVDRDQQIMALEAALEASRAREADLRAACVAAVAYCAVIQGRAALGNVQLLERGGALAQGVDLDVLYDDWIDKARAALAAQPAEPDWTNHHAECRWQTQEKWWGCHPACPTYVREVAAVQPAEGQGFQTPACNSCHPHLLGTCPCACHTVGPAEGRAASIVADFAAYMGDEPAEGQQ